MDSDMDDKPEKRCMLLSLMKELVQLLMLLLLLLVLLLLLFALFMVCFVRNPVYVGIGVVVIVNVIVIIYMCNRGEKQKQKQKQKQRGNSSGDELEDAIDTANVEAFIDRMIKEKPMRFTAQQLRIATDNYSRLLGSGGFGSVYKGSLLNGVPIAVKLLSRERCDAKIREQFVAEVSTIGTTHHLNLVRLYGFCFERGLLALVYEYMENGSLDKLLFHEKKKVDWKTLHDIAIGTAKGIAYLHEECERRIIHYDIKPGNILLDADYHPKVADFGLAKLCSRDNTHVTLTGFKGTPGYAAPELWIPCSITHKCDVYSFGMVLFEILGRRRNLNLGVSESQEWFPTWVWKKFAEAKMEVVFEICGVEESDREVADRMAMVGMLCVQFTPDMRPLMSIVANMLEGLVEIPIPSNPFKHSVNEFVGEELEALR